MYPDPECIAEVILMAIKVQLCEFLYCILFMDSFCKLTKPVSTWIRKPFPYGHIPSFQALYITG